jgi:cytochrome c oxidase assembly protein subunit 15
MLVTQVIVGGITRLTGSGLSITKWEIITGTLPPLNEKKWEEEFDLYKATPQYALINDGMEMGSIFKSGTFKFIYFWEYIHRFWARMMGFVFLFPCILFYFLRWVDPPLLKRLGIVVLLAALAASFGWIMVASGLVNRPWVNAYKLAMHLCIGLSVYAAMLWTCFYAFGLKTKALPGIYKSSMIFTLILCLQLFVGGVMSGMKAGLFFPTWPDMNGTMMPAEIYQFGEYSMEKFNNYDKNTLLPALIQFLHRGIAYTLFFYGLWISRKYLKMSSVFKSISRATWVFIFLLVSQVIIGIATVVSCKGNIPVGLGVLHQGFALLLLSSALYLNYILKQRQ